MPSLAAPYQRAWGPEESLADIRPATGFRQPLGAATIWRHLRPDPFHQPEPGKSAPRVHAPDFLTPRSEIMAGQAL
jgi:hypothetical protein